MLETLLTFPLLIAAVYWLPGRLALALAPGDDERDARVASALGLGLLLVHVPAVLLVGLAGLTGPYHLERWMVLAVSAAASALLGAAAWLRLRRGAPLRGLRRPDRASLALGVLTALITLFFLVRYDADALSEEACMVRASMAVNVDYLSPERIALEYDRAGELSPYRTSPSRGWSPDRNPFLLFNQGQRLGPVVVLAPLFALFGTFGFRLAYALQGLLLPGLGFLMGGALSRMLGDRRWLPWASAVLLAVNPYTVASPSFDENFLALCFGALSLALLLRRTPWAFGAGAAFAGLLANRHVGVLVLPVVLVYLARATDRPWSQVARFLGGVALFGLPCLVMHGFMLLFQGSGFEGALNRPPAPHSFLGIPFTLPVLLNFPFVEQPLRSPYQAWPTLAEFPLDLLRRFGLLAAALAPAGVLAMFRGDRRRAWLLVGWFAPILVLLMVQSNWTEPNKMGVPASFLPPVLLALLAGAAYALDGARRRGQRALVLGAGLLAPLAAWGAAQAWSAPLDERVTASIPTYVREVLPDATLTLAEQPEYVEADRARLTPSLAPDLRLAHVHPAQVRLRLRQLLDDLRRPAVADYERALADVLPRLLLGFENSVNPVSIARALAHDGTPRGFAPLRVNGHDVDGGLPQGTRTLALDLRTPTLLAPEPLSSELSAQAPTLTPHDLTLVAGLAVPWADAPENLVVGRDRLGTTWVLLMPGPVSKHPWPRWAPRRDVPASAFGDLRVPIAWPVGQVIRLIEVRSIAPFRAYERAAVVTADGVWTSPVEPSSIR